MTTNLNLPLYSLTIGEYIELNKRIFNEQTELLLSAKAKEESIPPSKESDLIFIEDVVALTGYRKATIYSKVSKYEIPVLSRRKPLTFSREAILHWVKEGKPSLIEKESANYINTKVCGKKKAY